ncbi:MAG: DoxX family protein [Nitrososphaeraceae archaeon]
MDQQKLINYAPFPLRIVIGIIFIAHGLPKIFDIDGTSGFFSSIGLPPELVIPVFLVEFLGGIAIFVGILTRIASILLIINMIGAIISAHIPDGFVMGYEFNVLLISGLISLILTGSGNISIEKNILKREIFPKIKNFSS